MLYQLLAAVLLVMAANGIPIEDFFPFDGDKVCLIDATTGLVHTSNTLDASGRSITEIDPDDCAEYRLSPNDDASSQNINISNTFPFFAKRFMNVFINTNGVISFTAPVLTFTPEPFPIANRFLIAPFWADVDTRGTGEIYFKETTNDTLLILARSVIRHATHQVAGLSRFRPRWLLIATWYQVGYFSSHTDQTNTFQAVLVTDGRHSFAIFNYLDDGINWNKGDASTAVPAQVGFNFGGAELNTLTLPGSRMENITDIDTVSNVNIPGQFVFRIDDTEPQPGCSNTTDILTPDPDTPSIIDGGVMFLTGPCFSMEIEKITCLFTDKEGDVTSFTFPDKTMTKRVINGITVNEQAVCPLPLFRRLGNHNVTVTIRNGTEFTGSFDVVPALHKDPDVQIVNNTSGTTFALIEHDETYSGKWKVEELNQNDFNETGEIKFSIENWLFQIHPSTKVPRWIRRKELRTFLQKTAFKLGKNDTDNGSFTFKQDTQISGRRRFSTEIIVLRKETENLEILYTSSLLSFAPPSNQKGVAAVKDICREWRTKTDEKINNETLTKCPCTLGSAKMDPNLVPDFTCSVSEPDCHENVNAHRCFLRKLNGTEELGQQCCYDSNEQYTTDNKPAGSADYRFPLDNYLLHQSSDYFPYKACCIDSNDTTLCDMYYQVRPKGDSDCQPVITMTGNAGGNGDPHFITLDGKQYTFNGLGEYTLIDALDGEFVIQIQTKQAVDQNGRDIDASVISAIAMRLRNKPRIQAYLHEIDGIRVAIESAMSRNGYKIFDFEFAPNREFDGGRVDVEGVFTRSFTFENSVVITIKASNNILSFQLSVPEAFFNNTKGLLGVWNGNQEDDFLRPNGTILHINSDDNAIFNQFGEQWSVEEDDTIFITLRDVPKTTKIPSFVPLFMTPIVDAPTSALITETCGDNIECAYDIAVTGNVEVGRETLEDIEEHMMIVNLTLPIVCDPPCQNDAPCVANDTCNCNTGFTGPTCDAKIIRCDTPCENGGNCTGLERCSCPKDYYGQHCDVYDPCILSPCEQGCLIGDSSYICQCKSRYILAADDITCIKCARSNNPTWHVALCNATNDETVCSGTAISDQWIMTSAECACNNNTGIDKQSLSIRFGKTRTCSYSDPNELLLSVSEIHCYPKHVDDALVTDIAAIKLQTPIPVTTMKQSPPLCIKNAKNGKRQFLYGRNVEIFGWGKVGETVDREATLQSTRSVIVEDLPKCRRVFKRDKVKYRVGTEIMCTIANTTSACTGNYGSAVVSRKGKTMYFGGIVNKATAVCGAPGSYVAHSKIFNKEVFEWIKTVTQI